MIVLLSGLQNIPPHLYEAARVDGAPAYARFFRITLPMLRPALFLCLVIGMLNSFSAFDLIYVMTNGGPGQSTWVPAYYTIDAYWQKQNLGLASAAAVVMLAITVAIFLPLVLLTSWQQRRQEAKVQ